MANLKEIRTRISSVKSTKQITSAMKLVSAAKLKKAQDRITQLRPYAEQLQYILGNISHTLAEDEDFALVKQRPLNKVLVVMISSNRGLCGAFNANVVKKALAEIEENYSDSQIELMSIGKKAGDIVKKYSYPVVRKENDIFDDLSFANVGVIAEDLTSKFENEEYDKIILVYNSFKNAGTQILKSEDYLPIVIDSEEETITTDYIFEPTREEISRELVPKSLKTQLFKAILDSNAAEHGARMTAMHQATDNATEMLYDLSLQYNKARQAAITNEILEIVGGAEALNA